MLFVTPHTLKRTSGSPSAIHSDRLQSLDNEGQSAVHSDRLQSLVIAGQSAVNSDRLQSFGSKGELLWNPHAYTTTATNAYATHGFWGPRAFGAASLASRSKNMAMLLGSWIGLLVLLLILLSAIPAANASTGGSGASLPYEEWLSSLQKSATGPIAFTIALLGIIGCGATLIFTGGEISRFMRSIIYIVLVMTLLLGANSLMTNFFNGAAITPPTDMHSKAATNALVKEQTDAALKNLAKSSDFSASANVGNTTKDSGKVLKPSVFANNNAHSDEQFYEFSSEDELQLLDELERELYAVNPDLTYDEHVQSFISGLLNESEEKATARAAAAANKSEKQLKHPSVFAKPDHEKSGSDELERFSLISSMYHGFGLNSYQISPLPPKNNALTVKAINAGNANLELQLFEFSSRTLKGFIPSNLDFSDQRLS